MQVRHRDRRTNHVSSPEKDRERWLELLRQARRVYFFQKWKDQREVRKVRISEIIQWTFADTRHIVLWNINILLQLRAYGAQIKKAYGLSYFRQWCRMAYLVFVIRTLASSFRLNHFFDQKRWNRVQDFAFNRHIKVHNNTLGYPHHEELGILAHKLKFFEYCQSKHVQNPEILAVFEEGKITLPSNGVFRIPKSDLFVKELAGGMGRGAMKFSYTNGCFQNRTGKMYTANDLLTFLKDYSSKTNSILVQHALKNHHSWQNFTDGGLATCRIVTGISPDDESDIIPFFASMKMPTGKIDADNFSKGSLVASVDIQSGLMTSAITFKPKNGMFVFETHPDTGHPIKGEVLPFWNDLIEFVKHLHQHFQTRCIGWDICLTQSGVSVLEGNVEWGSDLIEAPANRPLADTIYPKWFEGWAKQMEGKEIIPYKLPWY